MNLRKKLDWETEQMNEYCPVCHREKDHYLDRICCSCGYVWLGNPKTDESGWSFKEALKKKSETPKFFLPEGDINIVMSATSQGKSTLSMKIHEAHLKNKVKCEPSCPLCQAGHEAKQI